jgi:hypothetical protein
MKKLMYLLSVVGVALCMSLSVSAFTGSEVQNGGSIDTATAVTASGEKVTLQIVSAGELNSTTEPAIMLSSVADVLNNKSGLPENATELVKTVYEAVQSADNTTALLDKLSDSAKAAFEKAVGGAANVDNYKALSMCDITLNDAAKELIANGGSVDIDIAVDGVTTTNNPVALHITDDNLDGEVLPSKVTTNGVLTVTMSSFSPVVVFVESSASTTTSGNTTSGTTTTTNKGNVATSVATSGNTYMMAGTVALVAAAGIGVYSFAHKKDDED